MRTTLPQPPNGLPFSCRERWNNLQNTTDLAREAVGWNGMFGCSFRSRTKIDLPSISLWQRLLPNMIPVWERFNLSKLCRPSPIAFANPVHLFSYLKPFNAPT